MKTLGIIGGIGPESTIEYYRLIIALYREQKGDGGYPAIIINSVDLNKLIDMMINNELGEVTCLPHCWLLRRSALVTGSHNKSS